jgi:hypothetical protein
MEGVQSVTTNTKIIESKRRALSGWRGEIDTTEGR